MECDVLHYFIIRPLYPKVSVWHWHLQSNVETNNSRKLSHLFGSKAAQVLECCVHLRRNLEGIAHSADGVHSIPWMNYIDRLVLLLLEHSAVIDSRMYGALEDEACSGSTDA